MSVLTMGFLGYKNLHMILGDRVDQIALINLLDRRANDLEEYLEYELKKIIKFSKDPAITAWIRSTEENEKLRDAAFKKLKINALKMDSSIYMAVRNNTMFSWGETGQKKVNLSPRNPDDSWYFDFLASKERFEFNIEKGSTIYLNTKVGSIDKPLGIIGFGFPLKNAVKRLVDHAFGEYGDIWFVNHQGKILFNRDSAQVGKKLDEILPEGTLNHFKEGGLESDLEVFEGPDQGEFAIAFNKIAHTNLIVITKVHTEQWLDNHMSPFLISSIISGLVAVTFVMLIVTLFSISFRRSVTRISGAIQLLGEGHFDGPPLCALDLKRNDEFGDMARGCDEAQKKLSRMYKKLEQQKEEYRTLVDNIPLGIFRNTCQADGTSLQFNPSMWKLFGYDSEKEYSTEAIGNFFVLPAEKEEFFKRVQSGSCNDFEARLKKKDGTVLVCSLKAEAFHDQKTGEKYIDGIVEDITDRKKAEQVLKDYNQVLEKQVRKRTEKLDKTLVEVKEANKTITDGIRYARRIQQSLLPDQNVVQSLLPESFIHWNPRFYVGGDIFNAFNKGDKTLISIVDCTGHGVPGALMTMLSTSILRNIVLVGGCFSPANVLQRLNISIKKNLHQDLTTTPSDDGLDAGICVIDHKAQTITFAGARLPLLYMKNGTLECIKGDRSSIGYRRSRVDFEFTEHLIHADCNTTFYMYTDGYTDQLGEKQHRSFGRRNLKEIIQDIHTKPLAEQKEILVQKFDEYKGSHEQVDDVTIMGFKVC